jgi:hypothetical protein
MLTITCHTCGATHEDMPTWENLTADTGGENPICPICGEELTKETYGLPLTHPAPHPARYPWEI